MKIKITMRNGDVFNIENEKPNTIFEAIEATFGNSRKNDITYFSSCTSGNDIILNVKHISSVELIKEIQNEKY